MNLRMVASGEHERRVSEALTALGWTATDFGQGQLPARVREELRRWPDLWLRWLPDLLITRPGVRPMLVDAKAGRTDTHRFTIELSALESHERLQLALNMDIVYVCPDLTWTTPQSVRQHGTQGPQSRAGSGTPYLLYPRVNCCRALAELGENKEQAA